jgi:hypothetical protein
LLPLPLSSLWRRGSCSTHQTARICYETHTFLRVILHNLWKSVWKIGSAPRSPRGPGMTVVVQELRSIAPQGVSAIRLADGR